MKDLLYNEHRNALTEGSHFVDGQVRGLLIQDAIDRSAGITRRHMRGFAEWLDKYEWQTNSKGIWEDNEVNKVKSIDMLIDKYFESLNK